VYNIRYDDAALKSGRIPQQSLAYVVSTGKGVCQGYATVFKVMCELAGIPCQLIQGYGRGVNYDPLKKEEQMTVNHAWNAVKIGEGWYLMDVTWDSNYLWQSRRYSQVWFLSKPEAMAFSHFPQNITWQFLNPPMKAVDFKKLPDLSPQFFMITKDVPENLVKRQVVEGEYELLLPALNPGYEFSFSLFETDVYTDALKNGKSCTSLAGAVFVEETADHTLVRVIFPEKKIYTLTISWRERAEGEEGLSKSYEGCGEMLFRNTVPNARRFPSHFALPVGTRLLEPKYGPLYYGTEQEFHFFLPDTATVYVDAGRGFQPYKSLNAEGEFRFTVTIPEKKDARIESIGISTLVDAKTRHYWTVINYQLAEK